MRLAPMIRFRRHSMPPLARLYSIALDRALDPSTPAEERARADRFMCELAASMQTERRLRPRRSAALGSLISDAIDQRVHGA